MPKRVAATDQLDITVNSPKKMTTGDMIVVSVKAVIKDAPDSYINRVTLFKTDSVSDDMKNTPKLRLDTVTNPEKRARQFTANFMIVSPEPGTQHYCIGINADDNFIPLTIEVETKVVIIGSDNAIKLATYIPNGIVDSDNFGNYLDRFELYTFEAVPEFGPEKNTGVRYMKESSSYELGHHRGVPVTGKIHNPDKMLTKFEIEIPMGQIKKPGTKYYLIWHGYIGPSYWHLVRIDHVEANWHAPQKLYQLK